MAELLVLAVNRTHPDPVKDRRGVHKKGDIIVVKPDGHQWGAAEGLPTFVKVLCPGLNEATVEDRIQPWVYSVAFNVVTSDLALDQFRIEATNANAGPGGVAGLTQAAVQNFMERWDATIVSAAAGVITFDMDILAAASSNGFWDRNIVDFVFTQTSYVQGTGVHTIEVDFSAHQNYIDDAAAFSSAMQLAAEAAGATVLTNVQGIMTIEVTRTDVRDRFRVDLTNRLGTYRRHRYYFTEAQVDTVVAAGGSITVTVPQLTNAVKDRLTE